MFNHSMPEHLPEDIAPKLRQRGVDEQILLLLYFFKECSEPENLTLPYRFNLSGFDCAVLPDSHTVQQARYE